MRTHLALASCSLILGAASLHAQDAPLPCVSDAQDGAALTGRVIDAVTGLPLQEAAVVVEWQALTETRSFSTGTDMDGRFRACSLPAGVPVQLVAAFGRARLRTRLTLEPAESREVEVALDAPRSQAGGRVMEHGGSRGIPDAVVAIAGSEVTAVTGNDGTFMLPPVPAGDYQLVTRHVDHGERTDSVRVEHGASVRYTIRLSSAAVALPAVDVDVRSPLLEERGFYDRRKRSGGAFLTRASWQHRAPRTSSDVLRSVAGVRMVPRRSGGGNVVVDRGNCAFRYIVDGTRTTESFQIDDLPLEWIEALEVYRGTAGIPGQFTASPGVPNASCGVIVVWTRQAR